MIMLQIAVEESGFRRILDSPELNHGRILVSDLYQIRIICPVTKVLDAQLCQSEVQPCLIEVLIVFTVLVSAEIINNYYLTSRLMELINFDSLVADFDRKSVFALMIELAGELRKLSHNKAIIFHYKDENQVVLICPNLDFDGTSLLSLETLGIINEREWRINDKAVDMDVVLGYAALGEKEMTGEKILQVAENILEMQKV